jgi:hypothetical protein
MGTDSLNLAFLAMVEKKEEMHKWSGNPSRIASFRSELDKMEDDFNETFGTYLEEILFEIHDEYCPDNEIRRPTEYMASNYLRTLDPEYKFDVSHDEGVLVDVDDYPESRARLVFIPGPTRFLLQGQKKEFREVVWKSSTSVYLSHG